LEAFASPLIPLAHLTALFAQGVQSFSPSPFRALLRCAVALLCRTFSLLAISVLPTSQLSSVSDFVFSVFLPLSCPFLPFGFFARGALCSSPFYALLPPTFIFCMLYFLVVEPQGSRQSLYPLSLLLPPFNLRSSHATPFFLFSLSTFVSCPRLIAYFPTPFPVLFFLSLPRLFFFPPFFSDTSLPREISIIRFSVSAPLTSTSHSPD